MKTILSAAIGAMLALSVMEAGAQNKIAERKVELAIEQQSLADALNEWAKQTGLQLVSSSSEMMNTTVAPQVKGAYTAQGALEELLKGTTLTYEWVSERAVAIREKSPIVPASLQPGEADKKEVVVPIARLSSETWGDRRVAANDQGTTGAASPAGRRGDRDLPDLEELEEIVVTGTHIAGSASAGSRVITLDREQIAKSGYATVDGLLNTLPQNFGGGVTQAQAPQLADDTAGNFNEGTAINLRGLGPDSTLVLIDGRRQPGSGIFGAFVDVSSIPTSAIERVEILPDGASAIYGSDAVGGVVNFILRKNFSGAESQLQFGDVQNGADQVQFSQLLGHSWSTGNAIFGYQYDDRGNLQRNTRAFSASDDLRPLGGSDYRVSFSNPGNIRDPITFEPAIGIPRGQDGTSLQADDLLPGVINYDSTSSTADLFGEQETHSAFLNANQRIGDRVELFANGRFATRKTHRVLPAQPATLFVPSSNPFFVDPFGGSDFLFVDYNFAQDLGPTISSGDVDTYAGAFGATVVFGDDWRATVSGGYGREETLITTTNIPDFAALDVALADPDPATAFNPFADGSNTSPATLAAIRAISVLPTETQIRSGNIVFTGPLFRFGEATSMLAFGLDARDEDVSAETSFAGSPLTTKLDRRVKAAFAEIALPVVTSGKYPGLRELSLSLAGRYEDYSDFGTTFNEKVGMTWVPVESLKIRATWGTSFKAPRLNQLIEGTPEAFDFFLPLQSPNGPVDSLVRFGANPDLKEETADSWSAGVDWTPAAIPSLRTSLTFWRVDYKDRVAQAGPAGDPRSVFFEADTWAEVINLDPSRSQIDSVCRSPSFSHQFNPISVDECLTLTPDALVDLRLRNLALVRVQGVDVDARYRFDTQVGAITLGLNGVYVPSFDQQVTDRSPEVDVSNTTGNLLRLRLRGEASWSRGGLNVSTFVNYANSYEDTFSVSDRRIKAWTTVDGTVSYRFQDSDAMLGGLTVAVHALNVFDRDPPFANVGYSNYAFGYDTANVNPFGRILSLRVSKVWGQGERN